MIALQPIFEFSAAGTGTGSTAKRLRKRRNHAGALLPLVLLVPLAARAIMPDRQYVEALVQQLSPRLPGVTAVDIALPVEPSCRADRVEIGAIQNSIFGNSTLILRCKGSDSLPFIATVRTKVAKPESTPMRDQLVRRGRRVRLEIVAQGLSINTTGNTLAAGDVGDKIPVRAVRTNRVVQAQVIDAFTVRAVLQENQ